MNPNSQNDQVRSLLPQHPNRPAGALVHCLRELLEGSTWPKSAVCFFSWNLVDLGGTEERSGPLGKGLCYFSSMSESMSNFEIYVLLDFHEFESWIHYSDRCLDGRIGSRLIKMETLYIHMPYNLLTYWCWLDLIGDLLFVFCLFHMPRTCYDSGSAAFLYTAPKDVGEVGWMDLQTFKGR